MFRTLWKPPAPEALSLRPLGTWRSWSRTVVFEDSVGTRDVAGRWEVVGEAKHEKEFRIMVAKGEGKAESNKRKRDSGAFVVGRSDALRHPLRCRKIRLFPDKNQERMLKEWMGGARQVYNMAVDHFNYLGEENFIRTRGDILDFINEDGCHEYLRHVPDKVRAGAIKDLTGAIKAAKTNQMRGRIDGFTMKYRTKKDKEQSISIDSSAWRPLSKETVSIFPKTLGKHMRWKDSSTSLLTKERNRDVRLTMDTLGMFFICIPVERDELGGENQAAFSPAHSSGHRRSVVSIDPGVRTFLTMFNPDGFVGKIGVGAAKRLAKLSAWLQDLRMRRQNEPGARRRGRMRKAELRMRIRMRNLMDDLHWKACDFLCRNFETIVLPKFGVLGMVRRDRGLSKAVKWSMLSLRHYVFRERLIHKARFWGSRIIICGEAYTSKTCICGYRHKNLGGNSVFRCTQCNYVCDRDIHGSRNILCKNIIIAS